MPIAHIDNAECPGCGAGVDTVYGMGTCEQCGSEVRVELTVREDQEKIMLNLRRQQAVLYLVAFVALVLVLGIGYVALHTSASTPMLPCELPTAVHQFHLQACPNGFSQ